jgi:hypothetical protein
LQNLSGSHSFPRAQKHPEITGHGASFAIPNKLAFPVSWNYITEAAQIVREAAEASTALVPQAPGPVMTPPADSSEPGGEARWEMVIPKMSRPPAKPANAARPQLLARPEPEPDAPPPSAEPEFAPAFGMLKETTWALPWRNIPNNALYAALGVLLLILFLAIVGGAFR